MRLLLHLLRIDCCIDLSPWFSLCFQCDHEKMLLGAWLVQLVKHPTSAHSSRVQAPSLKINKLQKYYFIKSRASNSYHFRQIYGEEQHDSKLIQSLCICQGEKCCWRTQTWFWIVAFFFLKGKIRDNHDKTKTWINGWSCCSHKFGLFCIFL